MRTLWMARRLPEFPRRADQDRHRPDVRRRFVGGWSLLIMIFIASAGAETYKYQDEQGRWQYTDRPRSDLRQPVEIVPLPAAKSRPPQDLNAGLRARFSPKTPVQEATLSTVTIQTAIATGSGFFISTAGHLLTNKHVIQLPEAERAEFQQSFSNAQQELDRRRNRLAWREQELEKFSRDLAQYEASLSTLPEGAGKAAKQTYYRSKLDQYQTLQQELASAPAISS